MLMFRTCQHCRTMVLALAHGRCPSCLNPVDGTRLLEPTPPQLREATMRKADYEKEFPLRLAAALAWILGCVFALVGTCALGMAAPVRVTANRNLLISAEFVVFAGPGIMELIFAGLLNQYRAWVVTTLLAISGMQAVLLAFGTVAMAGDSGTACIMVPVLGLLVADIALIVNLSRCYAVIRNRASLMARGFEPVMKAQPVETGESGGEGNRP
jgi:hypothetical protein